MGKINITATTAKKYEIETHFTDKNEGAQHWPGRAAVPSSWGDLPPPLVAHFCLAHPQAGSPVAKPQDNTEIKLRKSMSTVMIKPDWTVPETMWEEK